MESKKIVEALMLGGVLVVSMASQTANATLVCTDGVANTAGVTAGSNFVKQTFFVKCSANVDVDVVDSTPTLAVVKGMSRKGMHSFGGSTDGGSVKVCETTSISYAAPTAGVTADKNGCS